MRDGKRSKKVLCNGLRSEKGSEVGMIQIDMPMPDNCLECRFNTSEFGYCNAMPVEFVGQVSDFEEDGKPEWCPLKAQEPRVMTLDEVKAFDWDYCYLEEERLPGKEYRAVCGDYVLTCITWPCVTSMQIQHGDESYGKKWRCWTTNPTDEQRKAVKWDD